MFLFVKDVVYAKGETHVALQINSVYSQNRKHAIDIYYWYPTKENGTNYLFGNKKVFKNIKVKLNAKIIPGKLPIILLANGGLRSSFTHTGWIASSLAQKGFIVVVPKPPDFDKTSPGSIVDELWLRPTDISLGLSTLYSMQTFKASIDENNVFGVGFFLGGTSMLILSGAKFDPIAYKQSCSKNRNINIDCDWFTENHIDLGKIPNDLLSGIQQDSRIKSIIIFNPELTQTLTPTGFKNISVPVTIIDLLDKKKPHFLKPSKSIMKIPHVVLKKIYTGTVYSAFSICTPFGRKILSKEGGEDICLESKEMTRAESHKRIIKEILSAFSEAPYQVINK